MNTRSLTAELKLTTHFDNSCGFLANRKRATLLPLCFHLLGSAPQADQDISSSKAPNDLWLCPKCGGPMMVIERLTAAEIQLRSPPALVTEAA